MKITTLDILFENTTNNNNVRSDHNQREENHEKILSLSNNCDCLKNGQNCYLVLEQSQGSWVRFPDQVVKTLLIKS